MTSQPTTFMDWNLDTAHVFLIILDEAGATWSAQTGSVVCNHRSAKGWRVPLAKSLGLDCDFFHACVCGLAHKADGTESCSRCDLYRIFYFLLFFQVGPHPLAAA